jgi:hypothetical protein
MDTLYETEKLIFTHKPSWCPNPDGIFLSVCLEKQVAVPVFMCGLDSGVLTSRESLVNSKLEIMWKEMIVT